MSSNIVDDNTGSGFAIPDDDDGGLDSFFNIAAEDDSDEDTSRFFADPSAGLDEEEEAVPSLEEQPETTFEIDDEYEDPFDVVVPQAEEPAPEPEPAYDPAPQDHVFEELPVEESAPYVEPAPVVEEPPVVESRWAAPEDTYVPPQAAEPVTPVEEPAPAYTPPVADTYEEQPALYQETRRSYEEPQQKRRIHVPSEAEKIEEVNRIVHILNVYRDLSPAEVRNSVFSLITMENTEPESEAQVIVKTMNSKPLLYETIRALSEAKNTDPVERVFYILELPDEVFYNLGEMAIVFTDDDPIPRNQPKTAYARVLVPIIDGLDENVMSIVEATEKLLEAAFSEY